MPRPAAPEAASRTAGTRPQVRTAAANLTRTTSPGSILPVPDRQRRAHPLRGGAGNGEAEAGARGVGIQPDEAVEHPFQHGRRNAGAGVADLEGNGAGVSRRHEVDPATGRRVADGVVDEVAEEEVEIRRLGEDERFRRRLVAPKVDAFRLRDRQQFTDDAPHRLVEAEGREARLARRFRTREIQHLCDESRHARHRGASVRGDCVAAAS